MPPTPRVGAKPRLLDKLPGAREISNETWELLAKAKTDEDAQDDIKEMLVSPSKLIFTVWIGSKSTEPKVGHSQFIYLSEEGDEDPFHRCLIVSMMDRTDRGDPTPYAVPKSEYRKWGKWETVTAVTGDQDRVQFFEDDGNLKKLFVPAEGQQTGPKDTPKAMIIGARTASYILNTNPPPVDWPTGALGGEHPRGPRKGETRRVDSAGISSDAWQHRQASVEHHGPQFRSNH